MTAIYKQKNKNNNNLPLDNLFLNMVIHFFVSYIKYSFIQPTVACLHARYESL